MTTIRLSSSTAFPPAFTTRERAAVDAAFGRRDRRQPTAPRSSFAIAVSAVVVAIALLFTIHGPAHADHLPAGTMVAGMEANGW